MIILIVLYNQTMYHREYIEGTLYYLFWCIDRCLHQWTGVSTRHKSIQHVRRLQVATSSFYAAYLVRPLKLGTLLPSYSYYEFFLFPSEAIHQSSMINLVSQCVSAISRYQLPEKRGKYNEVSWKFDRSEVVVSYSTKQTLIAVLWN